MPEKLTITKERPSVPCMDFDLLRREGLKHIEKLGSKIWTDYNVHDPGVTILEALCYAITELGYRTSFDIKDLLAQPASGLPQFFTAKEVLTCNPVTENDFRKIIIDIDKVKNSWVYVEEEVAPEIYGNCSTSKLEYSGSNKIGLKGLYKILLELDDDIDPTDDVTIGSIKEKVKEKLHSVRNLCEDFITIDAVDVENIGMCADIELSPEADVDDVLAEIYFRVHRFISPPLDFYSLEELLDKGMRSEEIFDGPFLENGFIDSDELEKTKLPEAIHVSDLYRLLMEIPGVVKIKKLLLVNYDGDIAQTTGEPWCLTLNPPEFKPQLATDKCAITFFKGLLPFFADSEKVEDKFKLLLELAKKPGIDNDAHDLRVPKGTVRNLEEFTSIQEDFPLTYGIGPYGLPDSAGDLRKAQANQLKGYMMFFDQLLANYFSQLAHVKDLLSVNNKNDSTYFTNPLYEVPEVKKLLTDFDGSDWEAFKADAENKYILKCDEFNEDSHIGYDRRNRFLDHLIARFGEKFNDYTLMMYTLYGNNANENIISDKEVFLADYPIISRDRAKAFNYKAWNSDTDSADVWDTLNVSGLKARVARHLGIDDYSRRHLFSESVYTVESVKIAGGPNSGKFTFQLSDSEDTVLLIGSEVYGQEIDAQDAMNELEELLFDENSYEVENVSTNNYTLFIKKDNGDNIAESKLTYDSFIKARQLINTILELLCPEQGCMNEVCGHEGFHIIEHILLRPQNSNYSLLPVKIKCGCTKQSVDPYSFRISIILPSWPKRFQKWEFRQFFEETIRKEMPAHIAVKICWVNCLQLRKLEYAYKGWLMEKAKKVPDDETLKELTNKLIEVLFSMRNVHPEARLHDCRDNDNAVILKHTNLGKFRHTT